MTTDHHATIRNAIDRSLAGGVTPEEEKSLREHLAACAECQDYLSASTRVIAGLGGFSFDVDPGLQAKVLRSLELRAQRRKSAQPTPARMAWGCAAALALLVGGSLIAADIGNRLAGIFSLHPGQVQRALLALWVLPSLCFSLLFPLLPMLAKRRERIL